MKQLTPVSIVAPGFYGLNTQESSVALDSNYALVADNCVIDQYGRMGARKGWTMQTVTGSTLLLGLYVEGVFEHVNADNTADYLLAGNNKIMLQAGDNTISDITPGSYTVSGNHWHSANINDHTLLTQTGHEPLLFTRESGAAVLHTIGSHTAHGGPYAPNFGTSYPSHCIAAYGRFWVTDGDTIYWTTDIADTAFPAFAGGTSGTLNIASILPKNVDHVIALAVHNNYLVIFCERNIVIYGGADNPIGPDFALVDVITGVGCIANDSIQATGSDLLFLSDTGIRSLGRVIQEKSLPMRDLTKNVRDDFLAVLDTELTVNTTLDKVSSVYSESNAFYLISFPASSTVYCLDMRQPLEDGSARVTQWSSYKAGAFLRDRDRNILIGKINGVGVYGGYADDTVSYRMKFFSNYLDMGAATAKKILKRVNVTVIGGTGQSFVIKAGYDYTGSTYSYPFVVNEGQAFEYGIAEYTVAEFVAGVLVDKISTPGQGSGEVIQIGFEANINGEELSVQKLDIFVKTGRIN